MQGIDDGPAKHFPDRTHFIGNLWHNTRYMPNAAPHNILNLDGGQNHVVRANIFADFNPPPDLRRSASAVYPKASTRGILIEQNLILCERGRTEGETARGIQLGDGAPASICDGDHDGDGLGDCEARGQSQEAIVRNNIIMDCNNGQLSEIMVGDDRDSLIAHNTVINTGRRAGGFFVGRPDHNTFWQGNILENGIDTAFARGSLEETNNYFPPPSAVRTHFPNAESGDLQLVDQEEITDQGLAHVAVTHDFCGYPRGEHADRGAIEYSTDFPEADCVRQVQALLDSIP